MNAVATAITLSGLLILLLSIPMILRRVPPNGAYGVRTKATFRSEADWYRINEAGGRRLAVSGVIVAATGIAGYFLPSSALDYYSGAAAIIALLAVGISCARTCSMKSEFPAEGDR